MKIEILQDKIRLKQTEINLENDATRRTELMKQLRVLHLNLEISEIRKRIEQLG